MVFTSRRVTIHITALSWFAVFMVGFAQWLTQQVLTTVGIANWPCSPWSVLFRSHIQQACPTGDAWQCVDSQYVFGSAPWI